MSQQSPAVDRPLLIDVRDLRRRPGNQEPVRLTADLAGLETTSAGVIDGRVAVDLVLESLTDSVVATGTLGFRWRGGCSRCLTDVEGTGEATIRELFEEEPEEGETYPLGDDHLDLEPVVRETVILDLPVAPLCKHDCAGLCAQCGTDLNEGDCDCEEPVGDARWAALDALTFDEGSSGADAGA